MIKFFFMAVINATLQGRPVVQFNTVSSLNSPDLTAGAIGAIQEGAANMANAQGTQFDDLVIQNLFCLTPNGMTEEQFTAGTALAQQPQAEQEEVVLTPDETAEVLALAAEDGVDTLNVEAERELEGDTITEQREAVVERFQDQVQDAANEAVAEDLSRADEDNGKLQPYLEEDKSGN